MIRYGTFGAVLLAQSLALAGDRSRSWRCHLAANPYEMVEVSYKIRGVPRGNRFSVDQMDVSRIGGEHPVQLPSLFDVSMTDDTILALVRAVSQQKYMSTFEQNQLANIEFDPSSSRLKWTNVNEAAETFTCREFIVTSDEALEIALKFVKRLYKYDESPASYEVVSETDKGANYHVVVERRRPASNCDFTIRVNGRSGRIDYSEKRDRSCAE